MNIQAARRPIVGVVLVVLMLGLSACSATPTATIAPAKQSTLAPTAAPTQAPTLAPSATAKALPSNTVAPTATQAPAAASPAPAATATPAPAAPATAAPVVGGDARAALLKALRAQATAGPFRVKSTSTSSTGTSSQQTAEMILPNRYHMTIGSGQTQMEFIIIADKTYQKQGATWSLFPVDVGSMVAGLTAGLAEEALTSITNVKLVGPDIVDGAPALAYTYSQSIDVSGTRVTSDVKVWVAVATGLPIHQEVDGEYSGVKSHTVQSIQYDPTIKIEAPM